VAQRRVGRGPHGWERGQASAKALIAFLTSPAVKQAWMAAGFEPR
jgi:hypothetical protein